MDLDTFCLLLLRHYWYLYDMKKYEDIYFKNHFVPSQVVHIFMLHVHVCMIVMQVLEYSYLLYGYVCKFYSKPCHLSQAQAVFIPNPGVEGGH